jgi:translation elongation factor EF-1beta
MEAGLLIDASAVLKFPDYLDQEKEYVKYLMGVLGKESHPTGGQHHQVPHVHQHHPHSAHTSSLVQEIEKARQQLKSSLNAVGPNHHNHHGRAHQGHHPGDIARIKQLEDGMQLLNQRVLALEELVRKLTVQPTSAVKNGHEEPVKSVSQSSKAPEPAKAPAAGDDDEFDMFGSEDEDPEALKEREERLRAYAVKKAGKTPLIAKSNIILDVKPWDDETDMSEMERLVRTIQCDGLLWGQAKLVPLAYGIKKLQISCVVEDDKVGTDFLEEEITTFEDLVQSVDVAAFNKI